MLPDVSFSAPWRLFGWLAFSATLLSACAAPVPSVTAPTPMPGSVATSTPVMVTPSSPVVPTVQADPLPASVPPPPSPTPVIEAGPGPAALLRYAERLRGLSVGELTLEIAALGEPGPDVQRQMQLALALMHTHQPVDTARALGLLQRVAAGTGNDSANVRPLARVLAGRLLEQRKLEDANDRQAQQLRDQQRRIEQLTDRLEAMRAIERSLNTRPPAAPRAVPPGATP